MFPILDARGNVIGFGGRVIGAGEPKYLNSPETPLFEKGRELYGLYQARRAIRDANQVIVVEGYMDVVALAQHGVENAVATLGTATTPFHLAKLMKLADNVVFCFDGDAAGRKAAWRALEVALPVLADGKVVSFLFLPREDDPDTYVRREGKEGFARALAEAKPLSQFLFAELASRVDMANEEGRARFLAEARPLVAQIEAPALAVMLRRRMAELAQLSADEIEQLVPSKVAPRRAPAAPVRTVRKATQPLQQRLLVLIASSPEIAAEIPPEVISGSGADWAALRDVIAFFMEDSRRNLGQASAYFEGSEVASVLRLALEDPLFEEASSPDFNVKDEVADLVERLKEMQRSRRSDELLKLLVAGTATEDEKAEYREIAAHQATAKSGNPSPEARSKL